MSANAVNECPICMEPIEMTKNCLTTECGHCFHTSCLMTSVAHNGFGCPYCRTKMAEEVVDEDSEYDDEEEIYEQYDDYVLRGLRFFNNNLDGEQHDQEDLDEEEDEEDQYESSETENEADENEADENEGNTTPPPVSYVAQKLTEQGVTTEDLLKAILCSCHDYERDYEDFERVENEIVGRVSTILNNYTPRRWRPSC
jgi:hypothetical protein